MKESFRNADGGVILLNLVDCINTNVAYLSELDGKIGDGDHGINMGKGFRIFSVRMQNNESGFTDALELLGEVLLTEIGGSMGPIYGGLFMEMAEAGKDVEEINKKRLMEMYEAGLESVESLGSARVGDKTMMDTLISAVSVLKESVVRDDNFALCLKNMKQAAEKGMNSTKDLVARLGQSARLGERSHGVLGAGAVSCSLIIGSISDSILELLN